MVQSNKGMIALAHNGNLVNAQEIRHRLEAQGSIFQTNSDTEVIVHLIALSKEQTLPDAMADALRRVEGAFSLVMLSSDRVFAARDPRGFRPLNMGRIPRLEGQRQDTIVFASETCAFDLIGATTNARSSPASWSSSDPKASLRGFIRRQPHSRAAFSNTYIFRGPTAWYLGVRCKSAAKAWADNWRGKLRPTPISWFRFPTPA